MDLISKKDVYKKGSVTLTEKIFRSGANEVARVTLSLGKNAVLIIPVDKDGNFYLGQQKRGDSEDFMLEFPNGGVEKGENELDAAKRELSEELGLEGEMEYLGKFRPFYSLVDLEVGVYVCRNAVEQDNLKKEQADFYETIERKKYSLEEVYDFVRNGTLTESYILSALSLYRAMFGNEGRVTRGKER